MTEIRLDSRLKKRTLYIFLVRTNSFFSRVIAFFTKTNYTHASVGFDPCCNSLYSFARIFTALPIPAGFVKESTKTGLLSLSPNAPCAVYKLRVTEQTYEDIENELQRMYLNKEQYGYNYLGPIACFFGIPFKLEKHYFCSQFVAELLERHRAVTLVKPASLYHPRDIEKLKGLELIYRGRLSDLTPERLSKHRRPENIRDLTAQL
ncbi:inositol transport system substrate-binding protein [Ruminococcus sp. YE71]|uniref:hypothetical protein n=1 Tax=unclassified Ruminococcus TaxID=2608920 RepID=UPI000885F161|nr:MULTISPECIES: hypothetical protein [unclassified Ruminococcus]SDA29335.1 inositol transport system substrate-binding protein [Ruminococcus sp. YE78]SFW48050.1 inositol transport system substrate-binding protein [Ruminococcus sp. YE71]